MPSVRVKGPIQWDLWPLFFTSFVCHFHLCLCSICFLPLLPMLHVPGLTKTALGLVFLISGLLVKCSSGCILISKRHEHPGARSLRSWLHCHEIRVHNSSNMPFAVKLLLTLSSDFDYSTRNILSYHNSPKYYIIRISLLPVSFILKLRYFIKSLLRTFSGQNNVSGVGKWN